MQVENLSGVDVGQSRGRASQAKDHNQQIHKLEKKMFQYNADKTPIIHAFTHGGGYKPHQSLQTAGVSEAQPRTEETGEEQERSAAGREDYREEDVGLRKKQAVVSVLHQEGDAAHGHNHPHNLAKEKQKMNVVL